MNPDLDIAATHFFAEKFVLMLDDITIFREEEKTVLVQTLLVLNRISKISSYVCPTLNAMAPCPPSKKNIRPWQQQSNGGISLYLD